MLAPVSTSRFVLLHRATGTPVRTLYACAGDKLYDVLDRNGVEVRTTCRGSTICGQCWVYVEDGAEAVAPPAPDAAALLKRFAPAGGPVRLACRLELPPNRDRLVVSTDYWRPPTS